MKKLIISAAVLFVTGCSYKETPVSSTAYEYYAQNKEQLFPAVYLRPENVKDEYYTDANGNKIPVERINDLPIDSSSAYFRMLQRTNKLQKHFQVRKPGKQ